MKFVLLKLLILVDIVKKRASHFNINLDQFENCLEND